MEKYQGILFFGQSLEIAGRGISSFRLRTAAKKAGYNVLVIDFMGDLNEDQMLSIIACHNNDDLKFIGFSTSWIENANKNLLSWYSKSFFEKLKNKFKNLYIITGGHDFANREELLEHSKYHFHGFSDNTFIEFLKMINNRPHNIIFTKNSSVPNGLFIDSNKTDPITNPDSIETVLEIDDNFLPYQPIPIEISRGCIFRCSFCRHPFQGKKDYDSYQRTPESIARELARNYELFGSTRYTIMDDTFNDTMEKMNRLERAIEIAKIPNFEFVAYIRPELLVTKPEMINKLSSLGLRGAFFGIESFNTTARKAIGKGIDVRNVIDAAHKLNECGALVHASLIIGLPGDSPDDIIKSQNYLMSRESPFRSWYWQSLGIRNEGNGGIKESQSLFDKNFEFYGYKIPLHSNKWSNEHFNYATAAILTAKLNKQSEKHQKYAGWKVAGAWHLNKTNEQIENDILDSAEFLKELKIQSAERVKLELDRLLEKRHA